MRALCVQPTIRTPAGAVVPPQLQSSNCNQHADERDVLIAQNLRSSPERAGRLRLVRQNPTPRAGLSQWEGGHDLCSRQHEAPRPDEVAPTRQDTPDDASSSARALSRRCADRSDDIAGTAPRPRRTRSQSTRTGRRTFALGRGAEASRRGLSSSPGVDAIQRLPRRGSGSGINVRRMRGANGLSAIHRCLNQPIPGPEALHSPRARPLVRPRVNRLIARAGSEATRALGANPHGWGSPARPALPDPAPAA
jgi:hypothetical protein